MKIILEGLIKQLQKLDIKISLDKGELSIDAPKGKLTKELITRLKDNKSELIKYLETKGSNRVINLDYLKSEAQLDEDIQPIAKIDSNLIVNNILLTGATGFVGSFILAQLLQKTSANIYCLTRTTTPEKALQKIEQSLKSYYLEQKIDLSRIIALPGDLSKPKLNLAKETYEQLATTIDIIYHNGALVHHATPYDKLKNTNVLGTQEILRFACYKKTKPVHFISTISVFNLNNASTVNLIKEQDSIEQYQAPLGGYSQSKWVAEKLVTIANQRDLPTTIHRLGPISGSSDTGAFNSNDFLYRLIIGYVHLRSAPEGTMLLDILPVDYVSKAVVYLTQDPNNWNKAYHYIHPQPASSDILFDRLEKAGYAIARIPYQQWYTKLVNIAKNSQDHILYPLVSLFSANNSGEAQNKSFNLKFDCQNTLKGLEASSIECPAINGELIDTYINYLKKNGLLSDSYSMSDR